MGNLLLQKSGDTPTNGVSPMPNGIIGSSLSGIDHVKNVGYILIRAFTPLIVTTIKYVIGGYAIHALGKQSHVISTIESAGLSFLIWMGNTPLKSLQEGGFSSKSITFLLISGTLGYILFFTKFSKFNFIGRDILRIIGDLWFSIQYLSKASVQYQKYGDGKTLSNKIRKYFGFSSFNGVNYFKLTKLKKEFFLSTDLNKVQVYSKIEEYFKKHFNVSIVDFDIEKSEYKIHRPKDMKSDSFEKFSSQDMLHFLGLDIHRYNLTLSVENVIILRISPKRKKETIFLKDYVQSFEKGKYYFGKNMNGDIVSRSLKFSRSQSLGIYGQTGFGKSNFAISLFVSGIIANKNAYMWFIIDPKGGDFSFSKSLNDVQYAHELDDMIRIIDEANLRMETSQFKLHYLDMHNLEEYLEKVPPSDRVISMRPMFLYVEELSLLLDMIEMKYGTKIREQYANKIANLICLGRSTGLTMIISTQKPLANMIGGSIVKEMITPISFKTPSETLIFQHKTGLNPNALEVGEAIYETEGGDHVKFQGFYVDDSLISDLKNHYRSLFDVTPIDRYLAFARDMRKFSFEDSRKFGVSKSIFDKCSREMQESGELIKSKSNHLQFSDDMNFEQE